MGYTNPYQSSTGLNFLMLVLNSFAEGDESPDVVAGCRQRLRSLPGRRPLFVAQNHAANARRGPGQWACWDAMVMEYQSWINVQGMEEYTFIPFGVRHGQSRSTPRLKRINLSAKCWKSFAEFITSQTKSGEQIWFQSESRLSKRIHNRRSFLNRPGAENMEAKEIRRPPHRRGILRWTYPAPCKGLRLDNVKRALIESSGPDQFNQFDRPCDLQRRRECRSLYPSF